jgi:hypothetical protein
MTDDQRMRINEISAKVARREISSLEFPYWRGYVYAHRAGPLPGTDIPRLDVITARHSKQTYLMRRKTIQSRPSYRRYSTLLPSTRHYLTPAGWTGFLLVSEFKYVPVTVLFILAWEGMG